MVNKKYGIAMCETLQYLKGINQNDLNKIPRKFIKFLNDNCLEDYNCNFNYTKPLNELNISDEARGMIAMICLNYWCVTEEQKEKFKNHLTENELNFQEKLRKKYNPDNLFKTTNTTNDISQELISENNKLIEIKKIPWYQKIFNKILEIFGKK